MNGGTYHSHLPDSYRTYTRPSIHGTSTYVLNLMKLDLYLEVHGQ